MHWDASHFLTRIHPHERNASTQTRMHSRDWDASWMSKNAFEATRCIGIRAASKELQTFRLQRAPTKEGAPTSWRKAWDLNFRCFYSEARAEHIQPRVFTGSFSGLIRSQTMNGAFTHKRWVHFTTRSSWIWWRARGLCWIFQSIP